MTPVLTVQSDPLESVAPRVTPGHLEGTALRVTKVLPARRVFKEILVNLDEAFVVLLAILENKVLMVQRVS